MSIWTIKKSTLRPFYQFPKIKAESLFLIEKQTVVRWLFYAGILIASFASLTPWFLWPIYRYHVLFANIPLLASLYFARKLKKNPFNRTDFKFPALFCFCVLIVMALTSGKNAFGLLMSVFQLVIYLSLFRIDKEELRKLGDVLTKAMACILSVSIPFYFLYLIGFPLPHHSLVPDQFEYTFETYYFFLLDDRSALELVPRFHSVFLEPSHMGMACIALLYSQIGKWNKWRCRILFFAIIISFSLAAYLCLVAMLFCAAWMKGKAIMGKLLLLLSLGTTVVVTSIFYNKGQNLVNILIVQRMTTDENGDLEGDNRTTGLFTKEFEKLLNSPQVFTGKGIEEMQKFGNGNSGFRVFIYTYGLISLFFVILFFMVFVRTSDNTRAKISMLIIHGLSFVAHGIPMKFYFFIPLYILTFSDIYPVKQQKKVKEVNV